MIIIKVNLKEDVLKILNFKTHKVKTDETKGKILKSAITLRHFNIPFSIIEEQINNKIVRIVLLNSTINQLDLINFYGLFNPTKVD